MKLILASNSLRRIEILKFFSLPFEPKSPNFDESQLGTNMKPSNFVTECSLKKALSLDYELILAADTIVYFNNKIYTKPNDKNHARLTLQELSGNWHEVFTGLTLKKGSKIFSAYEVTKVLFHPLNAKEIENYLTLHIYDKAGSYAVQGSGSIIISKIEGCFYNVMGLPISTLRKLLAQAEINLWEYLS